MIQGASIVYFGPERWDGMWRNRHQLLSRLAQGNRVLYVEPRPYLEQVLAGLRRREMNVAGLFRAARVKLERPNLWIYRPPRFAPLGGPPPVRAVTHATRRHTLRMDAQRLGMDAPIVVVSTPTQFDARNDLRARLRVYHIVDDYLAYYDLAADRRDLYARREAALIDWADLVVVVSPELLKTKSTAANRAKFRLLPNGFDSASYSPERAAPRPGGFASLSRPVLGYVGLISVRLDLALLHALAAWHPEWAFVLMGAIQPQGCEDALSWLQGRSNVHILPPAPGEQVADYVRSFDLGLLPYRVTQETAHASPLKLYEYLAAGLPVVAAAVPGAQQFAGALTIAHTLEEWEAGIASELACDDAARRKARRAIVAPHTWDARVETLSTYLADALGDTCASQ